MTTIDQIKTACREAIALGEKLPTKEARTGQLSIPKCPHVVDFGIPPKAPFAVFHDDSGHGADYAAFVSHSRHFTPEGAKALLNLIETLESWAKESFPENMYQRKLNQICAEWKNE